jgi:general secretion pathway protein F
MPTFAYKVKDGPTRTLEGHLQAESRSAAVQALDAMGYSPVWVREKEAADRRSRLAGALGRRVRPRDVTVLTRQLASLVRAGVPILRALATIADQTENARLRKTVEAVTRTVRDGKMLSEALAEYPDLFPELYLNMVRSGESAGALDTILARLADAREKEEDLRRKVQAAVAYPLLVLAVGAATVFVLLAFFLPRVADLFADVRDLPAPTRILLATSHAFSRDWYWIVLVALLAAAVLRRFAAHERGRAAFDAFKLRMPLLRALVLQSEIARFARTLGLLIEAGIPIDKGLLFSAATLNNTVLRGEIEQVRHDTVQQGVRLSEGLKRARHFPRMASSLIAVGEESGRLEDALSEIAAFYEKEMDRGTRMATSLLEPVLILVVGGVVGFIVSAMLLPLFKLSSVL